MDGYWYWRELREEVLKRDKNCQYCGKPLDIKTATIDHLIPRSKNGSDDLSNLVAACKDCNNRKEDLLPLEFIQKEIECCLESD